jgi:hypothetical protein
MKIACLQFAPQLGKVQQNMEKANKIIESTTDLRLPNDGRPLWLVLPEMAFSGIHPLSFLFKTSTHMTRIQLSNSRGDIPLPRTHLRRSLNPMGHRYSSSLWNFCNSRLPRNRYPSKSPRPNLKKHKLQQHRHNLAPRDRNQHIPQTLPLLHRRNMGQRRRRQNLTFWILRRFSRTTRRRKHGNLHGHKPL